MAEDTQIETGPNLVPSIRRPNPIRRAALALTGSLTLMFTFIALFLTAFHDPEPNRVPVAIVGSLDNARQVQQQIERTGPGSIHAVAVATTTDARRAILHQQVQAALVMEPGHPRLIVASAASVLETAALKQLAARAVGPDAAALVVDDLRPLPRGDSKGMSTVFVAFGVTIAGLGAGVALSILGRGLRTLHVLAALLGLGVLAGLGVAVLADPVIGALTGAFWPLAGVVAMLVVAVAASVCGLGRLIGPLGLGLGVLVVLLLSVSSAGGPLGYYMLPEFYRAISQWLPTGTAMTAIRHVVYFDNQRMLHCLVVLAVWAVGGLLTVAVGRLRVQREPIGPGRHSMTRNLP